MQNPSRFSQILKKAILLGASGLTCLSSSAHASMSLPNSAKAHEGKNRKIASRKVIRPEWSGHAYTSIDPNQSFLSASNEWDNRSLKEEIFDSKVTLEMRQRYEDLNREYELRKNYDLVTREEQAAHSNQMSSFTVEAVRAYSNIHIRSQVKSLAKAAERDQNLAKIKKPVAIAAAAAAVATGQEIKVKLSEEARFTSRTNVSKKEASLAMQSQYVDSALAYNANGERYSLSLSRGLPVWDLKTGVSYGGSSNKVTASVSKELMDNLTCIVDTSRSTRDQTGEEAVKFFYGLRF